MRSVVYLGLVVTLLVVMFAPVSHAVAQGDGDGDLEENSSCDFLAGAPTPHTEEYGEVEVLLDTERNFQWNYYYRLDGIIEKPGSCKIVGMMTREYGVVTPTFNVYTDFDLHLNDDGTGELTLYDQDFFLELYGLDGLTNPNTVLVYDLIQTETGWKISVVYTEYTSFPPGISVVLNLVPEISGGDQ